jgi:outer membrane lipoprotein carrier protein
MKLNVIKALLLLCFSYVSVCFSGGVDAAADLYVKLQGMESLSARFRQTVKDYEGFAVQEMDGKLLLSRPNKIYWETFAPFEQVVVGNASTLWIYDPDLEQVTVQAAGQMLEGPMALLSDSIDALKARYDVEKYEQEGVITFTLQPLKLSQTSSFEQLQFQFEGERLTRIVISDKLRQTTEIALSDAVSNTPIPDSTFEFVAPEGVDVVVNE